MAVHVRLLSGRNASLPLCGCVYELRRRAEAQLGVGISSLNFGNEEQRREVYRVMHIITYII